MFNTFSHPTCRRWAIFYGAVAALLAGWLFFEKMPDGREELAGSVEGTFWRSGEVMEEYNRELMRFVQNNVAVYPNRLAEEYQNRALKAVAAVERFENEAEEEGVYQRLRLLCDSFRLMVGDDDMYLGATSGVVDSGLTTEYLSGYKSLKATQLIFQSNALLTFFLNYCAQKTAFCGDFDPWIPELGPRIVDPMTDEPYQAEIFLAEYEPIRRQVCTTTAFLNDRPLPLRDGIATIRTTFPTPGPHTLRLRFRRERCRDGLVTEVSRDFKVNVLERCE